MSLLPLFSWQSHWCFTELFQVAHSHLLLTSVPTLLESCSASTRHSRCLPATSHRTSSVCSRWIDSRVLKRGSMSSRLLQRCNLFVVSCICCSATRACRNGTNRKNYHSTFRSRPMRTRIMSAASRQMVWEGAKLVWMEFEFSKSKKKRNSIECLGDDSMMWKFIIKFLSFYWL